MEENVIYKILTAPFPHILQAIISLFLQDDSNGKILNCKGNEIIPLHNRMRFTQYIRSKG